MWNWTCCGKVEAGHGRDGDDWSVQCDEPIVSEPGRQSIRTGFKHRQPLHTSMSALDARSEFSDTMTEPLICDSIGSESFMQSGCESYAKTEDLTSEASPSTKCSEAGDRAWRSSSSLQLDEGTPLGLESSSLGDAQKGCSKAESVEAAVDQGQLHPRVGTGRKLQDCALTATETPNSSADLDPAKAVILIDWDDTLCPTTWALSLVESAKDERDLIRMEETFAEQLEQHCVAVVKFLRAARAVAQVAVVTLATEDFFEQSADTFLEGANIQRLFTELGIKVYFAKRSSQGGKKEVAAKREAMNRCLADLYPSYGVWRTTRRNVLCLGDSDIEMMAIKQVAQARWRRPLCKTVKFESQPSLAALTMQLNKVAPQLPAMIACEKDFDVTSWKGLTPA